jgi:putative flippase GtrA
MTRVGKFGLVGIINTLLDFTIYNILSSTFGLGLVLANIISTSIALVFSFVANKKVVFRHQHGSTLKQAAVFLGVTAFGLYILQTGMIKLLTDIWIAPIALGLTGAHLLHITGHDQFLAKNGAKAAGTIISLIWNYIMYKKVVFS